MDITAPQGGHNCPSGQAENGHLRFHASSSTPAPVCFLLQQIPPGFGLGCGETGTVTEFEHTLVILWLLGEGIPQTHEEPTGLREVQILL